MQGRTPVATLRDARELLEMAIDDRVSHELSLAPVPAA